jgi:hypothetical protein
VRTTKRGSVGAAVAVAATVGALFAIHRRGHDATTVDVPEVHAAEPAAAVAFSFAVYGDSRPMLYLPFKADQKERIYALLVDLFSLVMPVPISEVVVRMKVKLTFDPATGDLLQVQMPFESKSEVAYLTVDHGWVTEASVEDTKLLPGVRRTMFRLSGGDWVARQLATNVQSGRAKFIVNTGDMVWWGDQGRALGESPYWDRVNATMLRLLPPPDAEMRAAGLDARFFASVGNHEVWGDPKIEGMLSTMPYLKRFGVTADNLIYKFDFKGVRFIYLWSGKYDYRSPSKWDADRPRYDEQMKQMTAWLDEAKAGGLHKAFIVFHYPVFCRAGMGPIPADVNPHRIIASYAKDMDIVVFNGHVHTTETFDVDGVKYLVLGGGGAEQDPILPGRTSVKVPADYPPDRYWNGQPPKEDYNYVLVDVDPAQKTKFTLNRYRPWSAEPFASVDPYGAAE